MHPRTIVLTLASVLVSVAGADTAAFRFIGHGALGANDLSPDGRWVVGGMDLNGDFYPDAAYRYDTWTDTFVQLPGPAIDAVAVSDDGSVVIGDLPGPPGDELAEEAAIWHEDTNAWVGMGYLPDAASCPSRSNAYELTADGTVAVGLSWDGCSGRGFRWTQAGGMVELEPLANGGNRASVISADGAVIAGFAQGSFSRSPAKWDGLSLAGQSLENDWDAAGEVHGMSDDGTVLLGTQWMGYPWFSAVMWVDGGAAQIIGEGSLIPALFAGNAMDIADDGTIVGFDNRQGQRKAWIKPAGAGDLVNFQDYIESLGATVPPLLVGLEVCQAISADGSTIIGHGFDGAWIVTLNDCVADLTGDGVLDLADVNAFVGAFLAGQSLADIAEPFGVLDLADVGLFVASFLAGCP